MDASKPSILVVDDEMGPRESLKMILNPYYNVHTADRGTQAVEMLKQVPVDLVTVDLKMPGFSGINVLEKVKQHDPDIEAIIITGYGSLETAITAVRLGAQDYLTKPFSLGQVDVILKQAALAFEKERRRRADREVVAALTAIEERLASIERHLKLRP